MTYLVPLRAKTIFDKAIILFENEDGSKKSYVNSATHDPNSADAHGIVGEFLVEIKDGLVDLLAWMGRGLLDAILPVAQWGCKFMIVGSVIVYFTSNDKKYLSGGVRWFLIYVIVCFVRGLL